MACAARMPAPLAIAPDSAMVPENRRRTSDNRAKGTERARMSARPRRRPGSGHRHRPSSAFMAWRRLITSCSTMPPRRGRPSRHRLGRTQAGDGDRHLVPHADRNVMLQPVVGDVGNLVDRERGNAPVGVRFLVGRKLGLDLHDPFFQQLLRPRVERGKGADNARLALRDDQLGPETMKSGAPITGNTRRSCRRGGSGMEA